MDILYVYYFVYYGLIIVMEFIWCFSIVFMLIYEVLGREGFFFVWKEKNWCGNEYVRMGNGNVCEFLSVIVRMRLFDLRELY